MDANGEITEANHGEEKTTAEKHSAGKWRLFKLHRWSH